MGGSAAYDRSRQIPRWTCHPTCAQGLGRTPPYWSSTPTFDIPSMEDAGALLRGSRPQPHLRKSLPGLRRERTPKRAMVRAALHPVHFWSFRLSAPTVFLGGGTKKLLSLALWPLLGWALMRPRWNRPSWIPSGLAPHGPIGVGWFSFKCQCLVLFTTNQGNNIQMLL